MAHAVLNVVTKDPEEHHVAGEVHQSAMHEERREDSGPGGGGCLDVYSAESGKQATKRLTPGQLLWDKPPGKEEFGEGLAVPAADNAKTADGQLVEEHQGADPDEGYVDDGEAAMMGVGVGEGRGVGVAVAVGLVVGVGVGAAVAVGVGGTGVGVVVGVALGAAVAVAVTGTSVGVGVGGTGVAIGAA